MHSIYDGEKKESLNNSKSYLRTSDLIFYLIKARRSDNISVPDYLCFMKYLYKSLNEQGLLSRYELSFDVDIYHLKRSANYNDDLFKDEIRYENRIYIRNINKINEYISKYCIDEVIKNIAINYCESKFFEENESRYDYTRSPQVLDDLKQMSMIEGYTSMQKYSSLIETCEQYPEVQLVQPNEERVQKQIDSLMPWINEDIDDGLDQELTEQGPVKKLVQ